MFQFYAPLLLLVSLTAFGQPDTLSAKRWEGGLSFQSGGGLSKKLFAELGIANVKVTTTGHHPLQKVSYLASEVYFDKQIFIAPKTGAWMAGGAGAMGFGAAALYYTDFARGRFVLRPETGIGVGELRIYYGYNFKFGKTGFAGFAQNIVGLNYWFNKKI
jgi:hypothetical protein